MIRLLCSYAECGLQPVLYGALNDASVRLKCGHYRSTGLLEKAPGKVSIEDLNSAMGRRLFPLPMAGAA
jgi:hypothetical protein